MESRCYLSSMTQSNGTWKRLVVAGLIAAMVSTVGIASCAGGSPKADPTTTSTTTAQGKPCVAVSEALPEGSPAVPIEVGPAPTSLLIKDLVVGTGPATVATSSVTVDYIGVSCSTGKIFDSSYANGAPVTFGLNQVIQGWSQGLLGMQAGGTRLLGIPANLAYGDNPPTPAIAPGETLWFVVELKSIA